MVLLMTRGTSPPSRHRPRDVSATVGSFNFISPCFLDAHRNIQCDRINISFILSSFGATVIRVSVGAFSFVARLTNGGFALDTFLYSSCSFFLFAVAGADSGNITSPWLFDWAPIPLIYLVYSCTHSFGSLL